MALYTKPNNLKLTKLVQFAIVAILIAMGGGILSAKETANWIIGIGGGYGATTISIKYPDSTRNQLGIPVGGGQNTWIAYNAGIDSGATSWSFAYEILVGYKHFLNDFIGFRYYANVAAQHYKDKNFSNGKNTIGIIEYTANADLLLNFYNSPDLSVGIFGGFGVGGASFNSPMLDSYEMNFGAAKDSTQFREEMYAGMGKTYRHNFSATLSVGVRASFFQQIRAINQMVCSAGGNGRRSCSKPISMLEHSIEANAKFSMLTYHLTEAGDAVATKMPNQLNLLRGVTARPGYEIKNPYKFTLRYIIAF